MRHLSVRSLPSRQRLEAGALSVLALVLVLQAAAKAGDMGRPVDTRHGVQYASLPLRFEPNRGQASAGARFVARGLNYSLSLTNDGAVLCLRNAESGGSAFLRMSLAGASRSPSVTPLDLLPGEANYLRGADSANWITGIPTYAKVRYRDVYPGVDLVYYGDGRQLEYDFVVQPGANPESIEFTIDGAAGLRLDGNGDLVINLLGSEIRQHKPRVYQEPLIAEQPSGRAGGELRSSPHGKQDVGDSRRTTVNGWYELLAGNRVRFALGPYDRSRALVIDPVLSYSTYLGAGDSEAGHGIVVDADGNTYVAGETRSSDFPVSGGTMQGGFGGGGTDAFVAKFNPTGTALLFSTFLGGENDDAAFGIALDSDRNVYVTGFTTSSSFPISPVYAGSFQRAYGGGDADCFVTKLSPDGKSILYSTYLGVGGEERCAAISVDHAGSAYVTGFTNSNNFPVTPNAAQGVFRGNRDAFVTKLDPGGASLLYSTYVGGSGADSASAMTLDAEGNAYLTGATNSSDFPVTGNLVQLTLGGGDSDAFVTKLSADGRTFLYGTFLGGSARDLANGIALDGKRNIYIAGLTESTNFPVTVNAYQKVFQGGNHDAFVAAISSSGRPLIYSTYLGGTGDDFANAIAVDPLGNAVVGGATNSPNFPLIGAGVQSGYGGGGQDAFLTAFPANGSAATDSTFLGGGGSDQINSIAVDSSGAIYLTGYTDSDNFPITAGAFQRSQSYQEVFVSRITGILAQTVATVSAASFAADSPVAPGSIASTFGGNLASATETAHSTPLPQVLAGRQVTVTDSQGFDFTASLFFVSTGQINFLIPPDAATGSAIITVTRNGVVVSSGIVEITEPSPGIFTANASGSGVPAAYAVLVAPDNSQTSQAVFSGNEVGSYVPAPISLGGAGDQVILELFATGIRGGSKVTATVAGVPAVVLFAGPQPQYVGLDQVNVRIPKSLAGTGRADVVVVADGVAANTVTISIQ